MDLSLEQLALRVPEIAAAALRERLPLAAVRGCPAGEQRAAAAMAPPPPFDDPAWQPLAVGERWGVHPGDDPARQPPRLAWEIAAEAGSTHWLHVDICLPAAWQGRTVRLALLWEGYRLDQVESIVYLDGAAIGGIDWGHRTLLLPPAAHGGPHTILIRSTVAFPRPFGGIELQLHDPTVADLGQKMTSLLGAVKTLPSDAPARHEIQRLLNAAYRALDLRQGYASAAFSESAQAALALLDEGLAALGGPPAQPLGPSLLATGHGHLDLAWLWPLWRTRQKVAHTVATALELMERHPDYHFSMSQPQAFAFLKEDDPALYARLRERVAEGRFEPVGMMWVEPDCNLPIGESLIRQLAHGARFFAREFPERYGLHSTANQVVWLPDVFGYSAALPQIMRGCGVRSFMTTKLSWNQVNRMPADTFRWRGIDGSEVLAHFVTATATAVGHPTDPQRYTYGSAMRAEEIAGTWRHYRQQPINRQLLYLFGHGDGGGGPTEEMLAAAKILHQIPGLPSVRQGRVEDFFAELYGRVWDDERLPSWAGELYFEYHRGTYTSQARGKQANRAAELAQREAEWLNAWAVVEGGANGQPQLDSAWEGILLNQFHDILPGSSIALVYDDSRADYEAASALGREVRANALATLGAAMPSGPLLINALPWERTEIALLPAALAASLAELTLTQPVVGGLLAEVRVQSYGYISLAHGVRPLSPGSSPAAGEGLAASAGGEGNPITLENDELRIVFDAHGEITSLYDLRHDRELAQPDGTLNQLVAYEDRPLDWDAWDIDHFYTQKPYPVRELVSIELIERGPLRVTVAIERRLGQSTIKQRISLWRGSRRIDFATEVDWHERQTLLRALFPLNLNAERATCEIQFGAVERATHRNTSWDQARFEVCAHRWADLAEGGYGVALLNDGKYGHSFEGSLMGLSLLKGAVFPDPNADVGEHRFTYSLYPHAGDWRAAQLVRRAYELNVPLRADTVTRWQGDTVTGGQGDKEKRRQGDSHHRQLSPCLLVSSSPLLPASPWRSFLSTMCEHVVVETVKVADNGDGLMVRLYEAHNQRGPVALSFDRPVLSAEETDMLERPLGPASFAGNMVHCRVRPFEVKTLRVRLGNRE